MDGLMLYIHAACHDAVISPSSRRDLLIIVRLSYAVTYRKKERMSLHDVGYLESIIGPCGV